MREVGRNREESVLRRRWSVTSRAAERRRKMRTERRPLDLATQGPPVTLGGSQLGAGYAGGRVVTHRYRHYYSVNHGYK